MMPMSGENKNCDCHSSFACGYPVKLLGEGQFAIDIDKAWSLMDTIFATCAAQSPSVMTQN
jgi:hypothetical protein